MHPEERTRRLDVLLPTSYADEAPHLREKTLRIGFLGRALAIFRADTVHLYDEDPSGSYAKNANLVKGLLDYMNTAPYLRKKLFPITSSFRYAGVLPPLNIPTHPPPEEEPQTYPQVREGLVVKGGKRPIVEIGFNRRVTVKRAPREGSRVLVRLERRGEKIKARVVSRRKIRLYTGFSTQIYRKDLQELVGRYELSIATSRMGSPIHERFSEVSSAVRGCGSLCVAFGSARQGLYEIARNHGFELDSVFSHVLNTVPDQGVKTVRTEEAVYSTLAQVTLLEETVGSFRASTHNSPETQ
ncbi:MAG: putative RNA uridine N3 methyltransferase [Nitrososphaeria archaeon]